MSTKKTEVANATKTNATVNDILTVTELKKYFIDNGFIPKYTDSKHYVGIGTRANVFSVNALKTQYNVYCNDALFKMVSGVKSCEYIANGNSSDKTRNNTIIAKSTDDLKKLLDKITIASVKIA